MQMIGNDIVDLELARAESNWRRRGYLDKLFTAEEQLVILDCEMPDIMVWLLWTMKESAYKVFSRFGGIRSFAPGRIVCTVEEGLCSADTSVTFSGRAEYEGATYFTRSYLNKPAGYIHTIASEQFPDGSIGFHDLNANIQISARGGDDTDYKTLGPISVSHHGRYLALILPRSAD